MCASYCRICPGLAFAMDAIFLEVASILYTFNIKKKKGANGIEIVPEVDFRGFLRCVES